MHSNTNMHRPYSCSILAHIYSCTSDLDAKTTFGLKFRHCNKPFEDIKIIGPAKLNVKQHGTLYRFWLFRSRKPQFGDALSCLIIVRPTFTLTTPIAGQLRHRRRPYLPRHRQSWQKPRHSHTNQHTLPRRVASGTPLQDACSKARSRRDGGRGARRRTQHPPKTAQHVAVRQSCTIPQPFR